MNTPEPASSGVGGAVGLPSALVIGGGGGIGAAISRRLAHSHSVAVGYRDNAARAEAVAASIVQGGGRAQAVGADVSTDAGVAEAFAAATGLGELRTVVHTAGAWDFTKVGELTAEIVERDFATNLESALLTLAGCAHHVADDGRVVLLSSAAAFLAPARQASYAAMKAGLEAAARVAAKELGRRRITVNVVRPGATDTDRLRTSTAARAIDAMSTSNVLQRLGTADDIAAVVTWLAGPESGWVTGSVVDANGGLF